MFAPNWSAKAEYQYYNFGNTTFTGGPGRYRRRQRSQRRTHRQGRPELSVRLGRTGGREILTADHRDKRRPASCRPFFSGLFAPAQRRAGAWPGINGKRVLNPGKICHGTPRLESPDAARAMNTMPNISFDRLRAGLALALAVACAANLLALCAVL